jgi:hypothetical protein
VERVRLWRDSARLMREAAAEIGDANLKGRLLTLAERCEQMADRWSGEIAAEANDDSPPTAAAVEAANWRIRAEELRIRAETTSDPDAAQTFFMLAETWDRKADEAEKAMPPEKR